MTMESEGYLPRISSTGPLRPDFPVWGLFGRALLYVIGQVVIVAAPWTATGFYRFLSQHVSLPDGRRLRFAGQPVDIWYILIGLAVLGWLHQAHHAGISAAATLVTSLLTVPLLRWFCASLRTEDDQLKLSFKGETLAYLGWSILFIVSSSPSSAGPGSSKRRCSGSAVTSAARSTSPSTRPGSRSSAAYSS